jgi:hypothetical protein
MEHHLAASSFAAYQMVQLVIRKNIKGEFLGDFIRDSGVLPITDPVIEI